MFHLFFTKTKRISEHQALTGFAFSDQSHFFGQSAFFAKKACQVIPSGLELGNPTAFVKHDAATAFAGRNRS